MLEFILVSGIITTALSKISVSLLEYKLDERGYVEYKKILGRPVKNRKIKSLLSNFIPGVNILTSLLYTFSIGMLLFAEDLAIYAILDGNSNFRGYREVKSLYEKRKKDFDYKSLEEAMILDGADKKTIEIEMSNIKDVCNMPSKKEMRKIEANCNAMPFINDLRTMVDLTDKEEDLLYKTYMKDEEKAVEKALSLTRKY